MSKGGQTATTTQQNTLDPFIKEALSRNIQAATQVSQLPYQPYSGPRVAGFRPAEQQAFDITQQAALGRVGQNELNQALSALSGAQSAYGNIASQFGNLASAAGQGQGEFTGTMLPELNPVTGLPQYRDVSATTGAQPLYSPEQFQRDVSGFMSPFTSNVVDAAMGRLSKARAERDAATKAQLASARAFGNERRGVYEAQLAAEQDLNTAQVLSNLMNQGYSQAAGLASQLPSQQLAQQQQMFGQNLAAAQNVASQRGQMFGEQNTANQMAQARAAQLFSQQLSQRQQQQQELASRLGMQGSFLGQQLGAVSSGAGLASQFAGLGSQALQQQQAYAGMLAGMGQQQRGLAQQNLDVAYQDFLAQRGYPVEQLKILQSGLTGLPAVTSGTTTSTTPGQGFLGTASGIAGVLGGLKNLGIF